MIQYGKVAVIMGGSSKEREVSLISGNAVLESLKKSGVDAYPFDPATRSIFELKSLGFDKAVIMLHGRGGEDGVIQGALDYLGIPYTGSGVMASSLAMDKYRTKLIWRAFDIPMAKDQYLVKSKFVSSAFKLELTLPIIVKAVHEGSTLSLSKVYKLEDLISAIEVAFNYDDHVLLEEMIIGPEFTVTVCDGVVYPLVKIEAPSGEYDYEHKYFADDTVYICPYSLPDQLLATINKYALIGYNAVGARSVARLDFLLDKDNTPRFLEINTIPGMTPHSLVPMAYKASGISFDQLCLQILDGAMFGG